LGAYNAVSAYALPGFAFRALNDAPELGTSSPNARATAAGTGRKRSFTPARAAAARLRRRGARPARARRTELRPSRGAGRRTRGPAVLGAMVVDASIRLLRDVPGEVERSLAPLVRVVGGRGRLDGDRDVGRRARVQAAADREARRRAVVRSREGAERLRRVGE